MWLTMTEAARELNVSTKFVRTLIDRKVLPGRHIVTYAPWVIQRDDLALPEVQRAVKSVHEGRRVPRTPESEIVTPLLPGM